MSLLEPVKNAYAAVDMTAFGNVINPIISNIIYPLIELLFGVAVVIFVWGILQFVIHGSDPEARDKGKTTLLYGSFGMVIMFSAWGIIYLISNTIQGR
jgi:large-conductance mechanosensitive channel